MRIPSTTARVVGWVLLGLLMVPVGIWISLTHQPGFYRAAVRLPRAQRTVEAKHFVAQSLQLRNDICNEPAWEAVFTDQEVNAWLAEDLVTHFADQLPPEVHEPRIVLELDRVTLAFQLDQGPVPTLIWVVARPHVPEGNVLELTLEKIRAGVLPVPADRILDRITAHAREHGIDVSWKRGDEGFPVVTVRYRHESGGAGDEAGTGAGAGGDDEPPDDVRLEQVQIQPGQIRLAGRSKTPRDVARTPRLPSRKVLQLRFPRRKAQARAGVGIGPGGGTPSLPSGGNSYYHTM